MSATTVIGTKAKLDAMVYDWAITKSPELRTQLIVKCLPLCYHVLRKSGLHLDKLFDELRSYAYEGLIFAVDNFKLDRGTNFIAYAYRCIHGMVLTGYKRLRYRSQSLSSIKSVYEFNKWSNGELICGRDGSLRRYKQEHPQPKGKSSIDAALSCFTLKRESDLPLISSSSDSSDFMCILMEESSSVTDPSYSDDKELVERALATLDPVSQRVLRLYYYDGKTIEEIAKICHVSRQRICVRIQLNLKKMKKSLMRMGYVMS